MNRNWQSSVLKRLAAFLGLSLALGIIFDQVNYLFISGLYQLSGLDAPPAVYAGQLAGHEHFP